MTNWKNVLKFSILNLSFHSDVECGDRIVEFNIAIVFMFFFFFIINLTKFTMENMAKSTTLYSNGNHFICVKVVAW